MNKTLSTLIGSSVLAVGATLATTATPAHALIYGFSNITNNNPSNVNVANQLFVDVTDAGSNKVNFKFTNVGSIASSITDIYFDDGELLSIASITDSGSGVAFSQGASPGNLPSGNNVNFNTTAGFSADSDSPVQPNGVNPGEFVNVLFNLQSGKTYSNVIAALNTSLASPGVDVNGGLRIGLHVQGIGSASKSDSFVNGGSQGQPVPEPLTLLGSGVALGYGTFLKRKLNKQKAKKDA